jgi:hypothetical protein
MKDLLIALMAVAASVACQAARSTPGQFAATAPVVQAAAAPPSSSAAYRVLWEEAHVPVEAAAKIVMAVPVTVRNIGNKKWPAASVFLAYHWFRDGHLVFWDGERTALPRDVESGGRASVSVRVTAPAEPGRYVLQLTLVEEHVTWFENKGADTVFRPVVVPPPTDLRDAASAVPSTWPVAR